MSDSIIPETDRRVATDRRATAGAGRRVTLASAARAQFRSLRNAALDAGIIVTLVAAIGFTVQHVRPIYAGKAPLAQQIVARVTSPPFVPAASTTDTSISARVVQSPSFERDRKAFAADLVRTGRMSPGRADSIAYYAVREAYIRGIPPAVIFGVMLTENAVFASTATSNVGAVGLMQVYPRIWLKELGARFGTNLSADSTNLKYGTYILSQYIKSKQGQQPTTAQVNAGLLHYNGCVHGTNTPTCHRYPAKVKSFVERGAEALCGSKSFSDCITKPFVNGLLGKTQ